MMLDFPALLEPVRFTILGTRVTLSLLVWSLLFGVVTYAGTKIWSRGAAGMNPWKASFARNVITASIIEEVIFRLLLVPVFLAFTGSIVIALTVPALLWGVMHISRGPYRIVDTFVWGVGLGWVFLEFGILAPVIIHITHNFLDYYIR